MADGLIAILVAGGVISGAILLAGAMIHLYEIQEERHISRKRKKVVDAVMLFKAVSRQVPELTDSEFNDAVQYVIRKYHMADKNGGLDTQSQSMEYISMLIAETVGQTRLFKETLAIAQADAELNPKTDREMEVITA